MNHVYDSILWMYTKNMSESLVRPIPPNTLHPLHPPKPTRTPTRHPPSLTQPRRIVPRTAVDTDLRGPCPDFRVVLVFPLSFSSAISTPPNPAAAPAPILHDIKQLRLGQKIIRQAIRIHHPIILYFVQPIQRDCLFLISHNLRRRQGGRTRAPVLRKTPSMWLTMMTAPSALAVVTIVW